MRYFYKMLEGMPVAQHMNALMQHQELFDIGVLRIIGEEGVPTDTDFMVPSLKKLALGVLQMSDGSILGPVTLKRLEPKSQYAVNGSPGANSAYVIVLHADDTRTVITSGDESAVLRSGTMWWYDTDAGATISNNGEDDAVMLLVAVRIDD
jgi:hypothetical protein